MIFVGHAEPMLAMGWVALTLVLMQWFAPPEVLGVLLILALAEVMSTVMVPQHVLRTVAEPRSSTAAFERVFPTWILVVVGLGAGVQFDALPFMAQNPLLALCLAALCLIVGILRICQDQKGRLRVLIPLRLVLLAGLAFGMQRIGVESAETILLGAVFLMLFLMLLTLRPVVRAMQAPGHRRPAPQIHVAAPLMLRQADLLALPLVLPVSMMLAYLLARGVAGMVSLTLDQLMVRAHRAMSQGTRSASFPAAQAALVNLGVLLVGGATALALLSGLTYLPTFFGVFGQNVQQLAPWLILATLGPAVFGAAPMLLGLAGLHKEMTAISLIGVVALATSVGAHPDMTAYALAQMTAFVHLAAVGAASAVLAWHTGVWPGLTAVLFRQIKLF